MTAPDPAARPDVATALHQWQRLREKISLVHRGCLLRPRNLTVFQLPLYAMLTSAIVPTFLAYRCSLWRTERVLKRRARE